MSSEKTMTNIHPTDQYNRKKIEWIVEEAINHVKPWSERYITLWNNIEQYIEERDGDVDSDYEYTLDIVGTTGAYVEVDYLGCQFGDGAFIPVEDIRHHSDILNEIYDENDIFEHSHESQLLYVSESRFEDFKKQFNKYFSSKECSKSPYSASYYNSTDIDWNYKPHQSARLSDHWNFEREELILDEDDDEVYEIVTHCRTDINVTDETAIGIYDKYDKEYKVVFSDGLKHNEPWIVVKITDKGVEW